ncbi:MAG: sulfatase [Proteiniphilum sp.]
MKKIWYWFDKKEIIILRCLPLIPVFLAAKDQPKPNILFIIADDLRPELGCYGVEAIKTPHIDRLAEESILFGNAYCNAPVSGASRASMLTGLYPELPTKRFTHAYSYAQKDAPDAVPVSQWFSDHGYYTISNGKIFHNVDDHAGSWSEPPWRVNMEGYESHWAVYNKWELWMSDVSGRTIHPKTMRGPFYEYADVPDSAYEDGKVALRTIEDLRRLKKQDKPFFLACGFWRPHLPFNAPKKYWDIYKRESIPIADNNYRSENLPDQVKAPTEINSYGGVSDKNLENFQRLAKHGYYACVSYIDAQVGLILEELDSLSLSENTIVVLVGDHGWHLGENSFWGKHTLLKRSLHIPLIIKVPGSEKGNIFSMVELVDLYPTLCDLTGLPHPADQLQGKSFAPAFHNLNYTTKEIVFAQWGNGSTALNNRYSYTKWMKDGMKENEMFFDHKKDPNENENVATDGSYKPIIKYLSDFLDYIRSKI